MVSNPKNPCCCDKCNHLTVGCHDCCKCVPRVLCVAVDYKTSAVGAGTTCTTATANVSLTFNCNNGKWEGSFANQAVDAWIIAEGTGGLCRFYLRCPCFNSGNTLSVLMYAPESDPADPNGVGCKYPYYTWTDVSLESSCQPNASCDIADVSISPQLYRTLPYRDNGCSYFCGNCSCVCEKLCISVSLEDPPTASTYDGQVNVDITSCGDSAVVWGPVDIDLFNVDSRRSITVTVTLRPATGTGTGSAGDCVTDFDIEVTGTGSTGPLSETVEGGVCSVRGLTNDSGITVVIEDGGDIITITAGCAGCGECSFSASISCCPDPLPSELEFTLSDESDCSCFDGLTSTISFNSSTNRWEGSVSSSGCGPGTDEDVTISLRLYCEYVGKASYEMVLEVREVCASGDSGWVEAGRQGTNLTWTCEPVYAYASVTQLICCDGAVGQYGIVVNELAA